MTGIDYILFINGVSGTELAEDFGVSPQMVHHWIKGRRNLPSDTADKISQRFGIPVNYITKLELTGTDRIEIEILLGAEHSNKEIEKIIQERNNYERNYTKLLKKYSELHVRFNSLKTKVTDFIKTI